MKSCIRTILVALVVSLSAHAGVTVSLSFPVHAILHPVQSLQDNPAGTRRVWGAVAASANFGDMVSTHVTVCRPPLALYQCFPSQYAHEANPAFAPNGVLLAQRFDNTKLGIGLAFLVLEEIPHIAKFKNVDQWDANLTIVNIVGGAMFTGLTANNAVVYATTHAQK